MMGENERKAFLEDALFCLDNGGIVTDRQGSIAYLNASALELTDWSAGDATGRPFGDVFVLIDASTDKRLGETGPAAPAMAGEAPPPGFASRGYDRAALTDNGELVFRGTWEPTAMPGAADDSDGLARALAALRSAVREDRLPVLEEAAHMVKKAAFRANRDDLADLAFRIELASRKRNWDQAEHYCGEAINQYESSLQGGNKV